MSTEEGEQAMVPQAKCLRNVAEGTLNKPCAAAEHKWHCMLVRCMLVLCILRIGIYDRPAHMSTACP